MKRFGVVVVAGDSMLPLLRHGDRLLVRYQQRVKPGELIVFRAPNGLIAIKKAQAKHESGWEVQSLNPIGNDSRVWGIIPESELLAVALLRFRPDFKWLRSLGK